MKDLPDLTLLDTSRGAEEGRELVIKHPQTGEPVGINIRLHGADSAAYRACVQRQQRATMERLAKNKRLRLGVEEMEQNGLELLASGTIGWSAFNLDGKEYLFSEDAAIAGPAPKRS